MARPNEANDEVALGAEEEYTWCQPGIALPDSDRVYSSSEKRNIVLIAALCGFNVGASVSMYYPSLVDIEEDFNTTESLVAWTVSVYTVLSGLMPLVFGPSADHYGRKRCILFAVATYSVACILCANAWNIASLIAFRALQAVGGASLNVMGVGSIMDVHDRHERGRAMGTFSIGPICGPLIGPFVGGLITDTASWRAVFYVQCGLGVAAFLLVLLTLPETLTKEAAAKTPSGLSLRGSFGPLFLSPVRKALLTCAVNWSVLSVLFVLLATVLRDDHGYSGTEVGLAFLPMSFGALLGSIVGGRSVDRYGDVQSALSFHAASTLFTALAGITLSNSVPAFLVLTTGFAIAALSVRNGAQIFAIHEASAFGASGVSATVNFCNYLSATIGIQTAVELKAAGVSLTAIFLGLGGLSVLAVLPLYFMYRERQSSVVPAEVNLEDITSSQSDAAKAVVSQKEPQSVMSSTMSPASMQSTEPVP